ncbi:MAG: Rrf2 family transcriptional regulator [Firmicutes bacterium]|nr:Rrf2 family transcriptional regulator [Bacillota bacterium]
MKISAKARYGVRALCALELLSGEENQGGSPVSLAQIAEKENISKKYLGLIFHGLRKHGFVDAVRGLNGGYRLAKSANEITVGSVVRALDGPLAPVGCLLPPGKNPASRCERKATCASRKAWDRLQHHIELALDSITIQSLVEGEDPAPPGCDGYGI